MGHISDASAVERGRPLSGSNQTLSVLAGRLPPELPPNTYLRRAQTSAVRTLTQANEPGKLARRGTHGNQETHSRIEVVAFQDRCLKPLGHPSKLSRQARNRTRQLAGEQIATLLPLTHYHSVVARRPLGRSVVRECRCFRT